MMLAKYVRQYQTQISKWQQAIKYLRLLSDLTSALITLSQ